MADKLPSPRDAKAIADELKGIANALDKSRGFVDDINDGFNLSKSLLKNVKKSLSENNDLSQSGKNITKAAYSSMLKAVGTDKQILSMKRVEVDLAKVLRDESGATLETQRSLQEVIQKTAQARKEAMHYSFMEAVGLGKVSQAARRNSENIRGSAQKMVGMGKVLLATGGKFGRAVGKGFTFAGGMLNKLGGPLIGYAIEFGRKVFEIFKSADTAAEKFRMSMGITRQYTGQIDRAARSIAINLAHVGVTFETTYSTLGAIVHSFGSMIPMTREIMEDMSIFSAQLGVSVDKSALVLKAFAMISRNTGTSQRNMTYFTAKLSEAAGTDLNEVMGDIADFAQSHYRFMARSVTETAKAAIEARRMGTTLGSTAKTAGGLLNFTQSIADEMEASVLLGQSIDLQRARTLAYTKDTVGLTREILRLSKEADFENMDPFQIQAFAKALGKSEDEIGKILQADREMADLHRRAANDPYLKKQLDQYTQLMNANDNMAKAAAADYKASLRRNANQARLVALQNTWNQMIQTLAEDLLPVIDDILKGIVPVIKTITWLLKKTVDFLAGPIKVLSGGVRMLFFDYAKGFRVAQEGANQFLSVFGTKLEGIHDEWLKSKSPHKLGRAFIKGFQESIPKVESALIKPFHSMSAEFDSAMDRMKARSVSVSVSPIKPPEMENIKPILSSNMDYQKRSQFYEKMETSNKEVVLAVERLRDDMKKGSIGANVYLDSQKLAMATDRATRFRNGDGVNHATAY